MALNAITKTSGGAKPGWKMLVPPMAGKSFVLYGGDRGTVRLYQGDARGATYNLTFDNNFQRLRDEIVESFRLAVYQGRPAAVRFIDGASENEVGKRYFRKLTQDYDAIIKELYEPLDSLVTGSSAQKRRDALASARVARLSQVGKKIHQFLAERVEKPPERTGLYLKYSYRDGRILAERHGIIGRGWRWIANKFAVGKQYYRRREAFSFFTALGKKYSLRDITEKTLDHLRLEGKTIYTFSPDALAALSSDGKMDLLESLESERAGRQRAIAPYRVSGEQLERLRSHPQVGGEPGSESRPLLAAFITAHNGNIEEAATGFATMTPKQRAKIDEGLAAVRGLSGDFLRAAADQDQQKAVAAMRDITRIIAECAFDVLKGMDLAKPAVSALPMKLAEMMKTPMTNSPALWLEAARPWLQTFGHRITDELAPERPTSPRAAKGDSAKTAPGVQESWPAELRREITVLTENFKTEIVTLLAETPSAKTAEQSWRAGLVETFETDDEGGLRFVPPSVRAEPGSVRWYQQAAAAKQSFINALEEKYMAGAEPLPSPQLTDNLEALRGKPFISRGEALGLLQFAAEEQRLQNFAESNQIQLGHKKIEEVLAKYQTDGEGWKKLVENRQIKDPQGLNGLFLRRMRLALASDPSLLQAVLGADLEKFSSRKQSPEDEALIERKLGRPLDKMITMAENRPRDYQALKELDEQADTATLEYIAALKGRTSAAIYGATKRMVSLMLRYMLLDPNLSLLGDREKTERGGLILADFMTGGDEFAKMANLLMVNTLVKQNRESARELAEAYKGVAVNMGWVDGVERGFIIALTSDLQEKAEAQSPEQLSPDGLSASPILSASPRGGRSFRSSSFRGSGFRASISSFDRFATQFRDGQFRVGSPTHRRMGRYGGSSSSSPLETDGSLRISLASILDEDIDVADAVNASLMGLDYVAAPRPKSPKEEFRREREQVDLKSLFRNYSSQLIPTLTATLGGMGAEAAWDAFGIYLDSMEYAEGVVERSILSKDSGEELFPDNFQALMNQKINQFAEDKNLRPEFEGDAPPMPPSAERRIQLLADFDVFNKQQGQELNELKRRVDRIINRAIRPASP